MKTWTELIAELGITMQADPTSTNPTMDPDGNAEMDHWKCRLRTRDGRSMTVTFSMGYGHGGKAPQADEVLNCLAWDAAGVEDARSFEEWCREYGYDTDSRKAERIFKTCEKQAEKLKAFLGHQYQAALFDTERL